MKKISDIEDYEAYVDTIIFELKRMSPRSPYICIPILDKKNCIVGLLKPITVDYEKIYPDFISLASKWRRDNPSVSTSVFEVTDERTKFWVDNIILGRKDTMLFLIDDLAGCHLGHVGVNNFDYVNRSCDLYNFIRGEDTAIRSLMDLVEMSIIDWGNRVLLLNAFCQNITSDNQWSIMLQKKHGFEIVDRIPLFYKKYDNEIRYEPDDTRSIEEADKVYLRMCLRFGRQ